VQCRRLVGEDQVIAAEALDDDVGLELGSDLLAELEAPVFLVLRVVLDQEPLAVRVFVLGEFDGSAADGEDAGLEGQVTDPYLG
jgi:hypothetical protein